ncbi:BTAD domain-containing putative transcriptional regulator [Streptomyces sp. NPDC002809]|uniref:AfsR/SARP family transcriptional regulator n=1 Tax=Streptomyces sp. NPDC002809 TaxID=3154433 RepID=UPI00333125E5
MTMRFGLLGPVLLHDGARAAGVSSPKGRVLLAALLLQANRPVALEHLRNALWGEHPPAGAQAALPNHVTRLRRLLALADGGASRLRAVPPGYLLEVHNGELDLDVFEERRTLARRAHADADWTGAARATAAALELWRGNPLADLPDFAEAHAQLPLIRRLVEARLEVLEWRFDAALGLDSHHEVMAELASVADEHPLREVFHRQLMLALHRTDRQAEALEVFRRLRLTLADELGVAPGPAVQEAYQEILTRPPGRPSPDGEDPAGPAPGAPDGGPPPPGAPEAEPARATHTGPVPEQPAFTSQLPMDVRHFVGRSAELESLVTLLTPDPSDGTPATTAPVVVTGMGGIGKTALAVHAAHRLRHHFPDGILYADLRGFGAGEARSAGDLLARFLSDLGAVHGPLPEETEDRAAMFRAALAERRVLLVLDNARDARQVAPLLPGSGASAAIVTSRQTLAPLPGADLLPLKPLGPAEQRDLLAELCGASRLRHEPAAAADILTACGGLPLALRIAGARLAARPSWPLTALAERLRGPSGRLRTLSVGGAAVRTTLGMSYVALRDSELPIERAAARAFRLLGLWPCHVLSLECAAALLGLAVDDAEDAIEVLVDAHLLESPQPGRYTFHDLLGEYAQECVAAEETPLDRHGARSRLLVWYAAAAAESCRTVSFTSQAPPPLDEPAAAPMPVFADAESALHWCIQELPAITEAIGLAGELRRSDVAWRLAVEMFGYAETYWWTGEWDALLDEAMTIALRADDTFGQAWLHRRIGVAHGMAYRNEAALESLLEALALYEAMGDVAALASITGNISMCYTQMNRPPEALRYARRSQELFGRAGNTASTVIALTRMTDALALGGEFEEAERQFRRLLALLESEHRHPTQIATAQTNFGRTLTALGRREEAFEKLYEALAIRRRLDDQGGAVDCLEAVAEAHFAFGDRQQARAHWEQSLLISRTLGLAHGVEQARRGLAMLAEKA